MNEKGITTPAIVLIGAATVIVLGLTAFYIQTGGSLQDGAGGTTPTPFESPPAPNESPSPVPTVTPQEVAEWKSYDSESIGFAILYPPDLTVEETEMGAVHFFLFGPTQRQGTEFYDGISLTFDSGSLEERTLEEFVSDRVQELEDESVVEEVTSPQQVTISGISGYSFSVISLGIRTYYYLPKEEDDYLEVADGTADPTGQGYEEVVDTILSTLTLL